MAQVTCVSSPTLTSNVVSTAHSSSLTTSQAVTVIPGGVSASLSTSCTVIRQNTTSCATATVVYTAPDVTNTQIVTLTVNVDIPVTNQVILYGSSCRTIPSDTPYTPPPSPNSPPSTTPTTTTTTTPSTTSTTSTPTPTTSYSTITTSSLVTTDGTTYVTLYTSTTATVPTMQASPPPTSNNTGAIVGGTLGGIAALALLALLTWHLIKKSHMSRGAGNDEYLNPGKKDPLSDSYQYGPVGQQDPHQPVGLSPPTSPGFQHSSLGNDAGLYNAPAGNNLGGPPHGFSGHSTGVGLSGNEIGAQANDFGYNIPNQAPVHQLQNPLTVPLLVGVAATAAGAGVASGHTRPNTSSSTGRLSTISDPVGPLITHAPPQQGMGYPPLQFASYPPALANYASQQQGFGTAQAPQGPLQQQDLGHNNSIGSTGSMPSGSGSGSNLVPMGSVMRRPSQYPPQPYRQAQQQRYEDPFARSGSPVSIQENRMLQVTNSESSRYSDGSSTGAGALGTPGLFVVGSSSGGASADGKGRPLNLRGEKAGLVLLDGGAYQDPLLSEPPSTPAPPAYAE